MTVSEHQDTVGPLARIVRDAAYILHAIAGVDPYENYTSAILKGAMLDCIKACKVLALSGIWLGVPRNVMSLESDNTTEPETEAFEGH